MHARHLAASYAVEVRGKRYYGPAYQEPRTKDRTAVLEKSYEDALRRWLRSSHNTDGFFFIEDTSVTIEALSVEEDYPGTDVKYWMRETSFEQLDQLLKERGNNRTAIVRSDVVLHLPTSFREQFGIKRDTIQFTGQTIGTVTDREFKVRTNLLYPWLDNLSFSRWFVPRGAIKPLSALPINKADLYDFRTGSIRAMLDYLCEYGLVKRTKGEGVWPTTPFLPNLLPPLVIVTGLPCAGKSTLGEHLSTKCGYYHIEASDFMRLAFYERHGPRSKLSLHDFAERALRESPDVVVRPVLKELERRRSERAVVTGFRSLKEVEIFRREYRGPTTVACWYVEANERIRYDRSVKRARHDAAESVAAFRERDQLQRRMGLTEIRRDGQTSIIKNEGKKAAFLAGVQKKLGVERLRVIVPSLPDIRERPTSLEETIILGLSLVQRNRQLPLTTTEIAHALNELFGDSEFETSKNNVSRYFNFQFHAFYKILLERGVLRYSLSATGQSRAYRLAECVQVRARTSQVTSRRAVTRLPVARARYEQIALI